MTSRRVLVCSNEEPDWIFSYISNLNLQTNLGEQLGTPLNTKLNELQTGFHQLHFKENKDSIETKPIQKRTAKKQEN